MPFHGTRTKSAISATPMSAKNRTGQGSGGMNFLLGQPSGILHSLPDVFFLQVRIALQNLLEGGPMSDLSDDHGHRNPHPANAGSPPRIAGSNVIRSNIHLPPTVSNASSIIICCTPKQQQGTVHATARRPFSTPLRYSISPNRFTSSGPSLRTTGPSP